MSETWIDVCNINDLPERGVGKYVVKSDRALAVFMLDEQTVVVMDDHCPHAGASLSAGHVCDGHVVCPWHHWEFHLDTGKNPDNPDIKVNVYRSRIVQGQVQVRKQW